MNTRFYEYHVRNQKFVFLNSQQSLEKCKTERSRITIELCFFLFTVANLPILSFELDNNGSELERDSVNSNSTVSIHNHKKSSDDVVLVQQSLPPHQNSELHLGK